MNLRIWITSINWYWQIFINGHLITITLFPFEWISYQCSRSKNSEEQWFYQYMLINSQLGIQKQLVRWRMMLPKTNRKKKKISPEFRFLNYKRGNMRRVWKRFVIRSMQKRRSGFINKWMKWESLIFNTNYIYNTKQRSFNNILLYGNFAFWSNK